MMKTVSKSKLLRGRRLARSLRKACSPARLVLVSALMSLTLSTPASAAAWCDGKISRVFADRSGGVTIYPYFRNDFVQICNLNTTWKGISPTTCAVWKATLAAGMLSGKSFTLYYDDATQVCSALPNYANAPSPVYVMLHE